MKKNKNKIIPILLSFTLLLTSLTGCGKNSSVTNEKNFNENNKMNVVVTSFVLYDFARQIGGDNVQVTMMLSDDADIFNYKYTNQDIAAINNADVFLYLGDDTQPWVSELMNDEKVNNVNLIVYDSTENINTNKTDKYNLNSADKSVGKTLEELFHKEEETPIEENIPGKSESSTENTKETQEQTESSSSQEQIEPSTQEEQQTGNDKYNYASDLGLVCDECYVNYTFSEEGFEDVLKGDAIGEGIGNYEMRCAMKPHYAPYPYGSLFGVYNGINISFYDVLCGFGDLGMVGTASSISEINDIIKKYNKNIILSQKSYSYLTGKAAPKTESNEYKIFWLNIDNAQQLLLNVKNALALRDPNNKELYNSKYESYNKSLDVLKERYDKLVENSEYKFISITGHFRYYYLINKYNLNYISIYDTENNDEKPSLNRQANVSEFIKNNRIEYIITDESKEQTITETICNETGAQALVFNTMINISRKDYNSEGITYFDIMEKNYLVLKQAIH